MDKRDSSKLESVCYEGNQTLFFFQMHQPFMSFELDNEEPLCYTSQAFAKQMSLPWAPWHFLLSLLAFCQSCPDKFFGLVAAQGCKLLTSSWSVRAANCSVPNQCRLWRQFLSCEHVLASFPFSSGLVVIWTAACLGPGWNSRTRKVEHMQTCWGYEALSQNQMSNRKQRFVNAMKEYKLAHLESEPVVPSRG